MRIPLKVDAIEDFAREFPCLGSFEVWFLDCKLLEGEGPSQKPGEMNFPRGNNWDCQNIHSQAWFT